MATYFVSEGDLLTFLRQPREVSLYLPIQTKQLSWLDKANEKTSLEGMRQPRSAQSPKGFFLPAAESLGQYGPEGPATTTVQAKPCVLLGVRACELRAWNYLDKVMLAGEFNDPAYQTRRQETLLVSCDCVDCTESCCCTLVGGQPFAEVGYDVNITPMESGYLLDVATDKGEQWLSKAGSLGQVTTEQLARRDEIRQGMVDRLKEQNTRFTFSAGDEKQPTLPNDAEEAWQTFAADCVECGACTHICPTCHCFYLYDQLLGSEAFERVRTWDSCLLSSYHRMAGGVHMKISPRPKLLSRLANRVLHKFTYSPQQYGMLGCVGCGRCIDACLGDIDIRQVVQELGT